MMTDEFFKGIPKRVLEVDVAAVPNEYADLADIISEGLIVLDFQRKNFLYVSDHDLFLCGHSQKRAKELGYEFFGEVLHPTDLLVWQRIHVAILKNLYGNVQSRERINHFACTLRFKCSFSKAPLMIYLKLKPQWRNEIPHLGICLLSASVIPTSDDLCVYYEDGHSAAYSFVTGKWNLQSVISLNKREEQILVLAQQGLSNRKIAGRLFVSAKTVENMNTSIFLKLGVQSMAQALQYVANRRLIRYSSVANPGMGKKELPVSGKKRHKRLTTNELSDIQRELDNGKTVNAIAKNSKINNKTIQSAIGRGKLKKL